MGKKLIIGAIVILLGVIGFLGYKFISSLIDVTDEINNTRNYGELE